MVTFFEFFGMRKGPMCEVSITMSGFIFFRRDGIFIHLRYVS